VLPATLSKDGTAIAFDQSGIGPALILVAGTTAPSRKLHYQPVIWNPAQ